MGWAAGLGGGGGDKNDDNDDNDKTDNDSNGGNDDGDDDDDDDNDDDDNSVESTFFLFCKKVASLKSSFHWNQPESGAGSPAPWPPVMEDSLVVFVTKPLSTWEVRDDTYYYPRIQGCIIWSYSIHEWRYCFGPTHYCISMGHLAKFGHKLELFFFFVSETRVHEALGVSSKTGGFDRWPNHDKATGGSAGWNVP